jgi:cell division protein ZapA
MGQVTITVNGRRYEVGCDDGEEPRLRRLAEALDQRVRALVARVGPIGEARLLLLAGLMLEDDVAEAKLQLSVGTADALTIPAAPADTEIPPSRGEGALADEDAAALATTIEALALRVEAVAEAMQHS